MQNRAFTLRNIFIGFILGIIILSILSIVLDFYRINQINDNQYTINDNQCTIDTRTTEKNLGQNETIVVKKIEKKEIQTLTQSDNKDVASKKKHENDNVNNIQKKISLSNNKDIRKDLNIEPQVLNIDKSTIEDTKISNTEDQDYNFLNDLRNISDEYTFEKEHLNKLRNKVMDSEYIDSYPFSRCYFESSLNNKFPVHFLLALSKLLTNFDAEFNYDNRAGIMYLSWPEPSKQLGFKKMKEIIENPCKSIDISSQYLSKLLEKNNDNIAITIIEYYSPSNVIEPEIIESNNINFLTKFREQVEYIVSNKFTNFTIYKLLTFGDYSIAKNFINNTEKLTGINLWLVTKDFKHSICFTAKNKSDKKQIIEVLYDKTGIQME